MDGFPQSSLEDAQVAQVRFEALDHEDRERAVVDQHDLVAQEEGARRRVPLDGQGPLADAEGGGGWGNQGAFLTRQTKTFSTVSWAVSSPTRTPSGLWPPFFLPM